MEINEEIVKEYFCVVLGCFVIENVIYRVETQRNGKKRGGGWSDIDLLAYYPMENNVLDIEVKYRERAPFHRGKDKASNIDNVIYNIHTPNRNRKIQELNKNSLAVQKIFVTNKKAFSEKRRLEYESLLSDNEIQLIYFETMFSELQNYYRQNPNKMTSIIGQMLRIYNNQNKNRVYNSQISS